MKIVKFDKDLSEKERIALETQLKEEERAVARHEKWLRSQYFSYVMNVLDEEISKTSNIDLIPSDVSNTEEMGKLLLVAKLAKSRLLEVKKRLT